MNDDAARLEATLLASDGGSVEMDRLLSTFGQRRLEAAIARLTSDHAGRGLVVHVMDDRVHLRTAPETTRFVDAVLGPGRRDMSEAVMQTLAMIALYGPCTRSEIEAVRGVRLSPGVLERCVESGCVSPGPRRQDGGRAMTWQVTPTFYDMFDMDRDTVATFDERSGDTGSMPMEFDG